MKLSVFYTGHLTAPNGASKYVAYFEKLSSVFSDRGIDYGGVFCLSGLNDNKRGASSQSTKKTSIVRRLAQTKIGTMILIKRLWEKNANIVCLKYLESRRQDDVIIFHDIFSYIAYLKLVKQKKLMQCKAILISHTNGEPEKMLLERFPLLNRIRYWKKIKKEFDIAFKKAWKIVFVSNSSKNTFVKKYPCFSRKVIVMPTSIADLNDQAIINAKRDYSSLKLVTVGSVCKRKNQISIIKAIKAINDTTISLVICGGGPEYENCKKYVIDNELSNQIIMPGQVKNGDDKGDTSSITIDHYLMESNAFIMSSYDEGMPVAAVEAMRAGLPLILSDAGGNKELIQENGILTSTNVKDITAAIKEINNHLDILPTMGQKSRELFLKEHNIQALLEKYADVALEGCSYSEEF